MRKNPPIEIEPINQETNKYPLTLDEINVHPQIKEYFKIRLSAAKMRNETLGHVLIYGKSEEEMLTFAHCIANELDSHVKVINGSLIYLSGDLSAVLSSLETNDILLINEIHRLPKIVEEVLYPAMDDCVIDIITGKASSVRTIHLDLPPFTLVGATTKIDKVTDVLKEHFEIVTKLDRYLCVEDLKEIVLLYSKSLQISIDSYAALEIARRSHGAPIVAKRHLKCVRDYAQTSNRTEINVEYAKYILDQMGVDPFGLYHLDREYLGGIIELFNGGPVNIEILANSIHKKSTILENDCEPYLKNIGFIEYTSQGRMITGKAWKYMKSFYDDSSLKVSFD